MGDDLKQAREFVSAAISDMDILLSDARMKWDFAKAPLSRVQVGAKTMQAQGIYRAAQAVIEAYDRTISQAQIDGRIMALYKLVVQYGAGLDEIEPLIESDDLAFAASHMQARFDAARDILIPLLPLAGKSAPALQYIAGMATDLPNVQNPALSFESLMPDVTNTALRIARMQGKSVSLSYATEDLSVQGSQVEELRSQLEDIVAHLIKTHIETPDRRTAKGLSRSGHIDITAKDGTGKDGSGKDGLGGLDISVICDGETVSLFPQGGPQAPVLSDEPIDLGDIFLEEVSA